MDSIATLDTPNSLQLQSNIVLCEQDRIYCDAILNRYEKYIGHINKLLQFIRKENEAFEKEMEERELATFCSFSSLHKPADELEKLIIQTSASFLNKIESYFSNEYSLHFKSLDETNKDYLPEIFDSYRLIIQNILAQVGHDFAQSAAFQVKERFQHSFHSKNHPILKGSKISLPAFAHFEQHYNGRISLHYEYGKYVTYLLDAIALTFLKVTKRPTAFEDVLSFLNNEIDFSQHYNLCSVVSLQFYKNRRIDMIFSNTATAQKFWSFYELQRIASITKDND